MSTSTVISSLESIPLPPAAPQIRRRVKESKAADQSQALIERECVAAWDKAETRDIFARSTTAVQAATRESPNIQTLDISAPQALLSAAEKHELIEDLIIAHQTIRRSVIEAGNILRQLRNGTLHGEWERFLAEICKKLKISRATAHNYMDAAATVAFLSPEVAGACRNNNLNLENKPTRDAAAKAVADNPKATPAEIVAQVKAAIHRRAVKNPAVDQLAELRKHYHKHGNVVIERVGRGTNGLEMPHFQVWVKDVPAKRAPSGDQKINVIMTFDQLRSVEGKVSIGANELATPDEVKQFLKTWGVK